MIKSLDDRVTLNNDTTMPGLGMGVFQIPNEQTAQVVAEGIKAGYRLIDTAQVYGNEAGTGAGIKAGLAATGLKREDLFITSKVWNDHLSYDETLRAFQDSLAKLDLDYLDLYLIHWPGQDAFRDSWKALEKLYHDGKIKAIGVSNFQISHLKELAEFAEVMPVVNQVETHPKLSQTELIEFATVHNLKIQAWSPLMQGKILDNPVLSEIAQNHQKSVAQIILRWDIQRGVLLVVKSVKPARIKSNAEVFDFELTAAEMAKINELNENLRVGPDPDTFNF
ncbi:aldo/keto reductase [Pediococcus acidilactici]|uniref:Oxidoreductase, aldo/keto reductase family protein n=2 Tax=Pediococcus acidilactici TaxID=1254 RepID=E0NFS9_PEDAC|nr:aldo/keto reductase [Pediococcus acidilactici]AZP90987.1 aldo/keto reductase [Pediococcus acidilactici]EFL95648.1 oxidoreductase, aldo/keto reductase family protein [Pediococcus acidilactici DSM 20284]KRN16295.1 2,5-diketo-D-gluconate reductase [Pediococcus acidilactici]MDG9740355.1 aldo/keto reductase [Pediococcus acidilactici]NKZ17182.1 aldo/keto reductase [Pediococcus acidilactici]